MTELARARDWEGGCLGSTTRVVTSSPSFVPSKSHKHTHAHTHTHTHTRKGLTHVLCPLVLQGPAGLSVQQGPKLPQVREDSQVTLARQVVQSQAWGQQLRIGWKKDGVFLCDSHVTKVRFSLGVCGPRWQLSWESRGNLNLRGPRDPQRQQGPHGLGDRGDSEGDTLRLSCLSPPSSNVTPASSSLQPASPPRHSFSAARRDQLQCENTQDEEDSWSRRRWQGPWPWPPSRRGPVSGAAVAAGAGTQSGPNTRVLQKRRKAGESQAVSCDFPLLVCGIPPPPPTPVQGILSRVTSSTSPGGAQRRLRRGQWRGRCWTSPRRSRRVYSISFPQPPDPQPRLAQKPCPSPSPSPGPPISTVGVSPDPRPSGQQKPRGLLEAGRGIGTQKRRAPPPPRGHVKM
ncbi:LOW QUALITY PROTEIN: transmembrane and immunoglobulin domain-containing protein 2 [Herpailurus yagouaroundi]|uniref:LOW QUALITY PROTEIN: transmembrane and immunoglobulin domain-containing protein 2 n=1 Tax=Herpailurus yagouaroundi TaxID=1608482 RepID=UPI001AD70AB5|nr:LOW QUALITY PROTEIN: transmembrane and immunoglobulin domain-containing protein 2 [Puma yagouaroundi]